MPKSKSTAPKIAACTFELHSSAAGVHLLPDGEFRTADGSGRPEECAAWRMGPDIAARVIRFAALKTRDTVIDYEHALLKSKETGHEAPAAGWWSNGLAYVPGKGMIATGVTWCERAKSMIDAKEYRFISPVFAYDEKTGDVLAILHFSLTNDPALDGLDEVALAAASAQLSPTPSEILMEPNEIMERLIYFLSLPITTTVTELVAELDKIKSLIQSSPAAAAAIPDLDKVVAALSAHITARGAQIAALSAQSAQAPDPAKFVPVAAVEALHAKVADLSTRLDGQEVDELVKAGLADGRILPEMEGWARDLGKANRAALSAYLDKAKPVAALTGTQTGGKRPPAAPGIDDGRPLEERAKAEWAASAALQAEFAGDQDAYIAYCKAEQNGQVKVFGGTKE
jgi:phage I-like protein